MVEAKLIFLSAAAAVAAGSGLVTSTMMYRGFKDKFPSAFPTKTAKTFLRLQHLSTESPLSRVLHSARLCVGPRAAQTRRGHHTDRKVRSITSTHSAHPCTEPVSEMVTDSPYR